MKIPAECKMTKSRNLEDKHSREIVKKLRVFIILLIALLCYRNAYSKNILEGNGNDWISMDQKTKVFFISGVLLADGYICINNTPFSPNADDSFLAYIYHNRELIENAWLSISKKINKKIPAYAQVILTGLLQKFSSSNDHFELYINLAYEEDFKFLKSSENSIKLLRKVLNENYLTLNISKLKKDYLILTIAYLISLEIKKNNYYLNQLQKYCLYNISVGQLLDGLDTFYQDFRNRDIRIGDAIYIVKRQIMGEDEEVIKRIIKYLKTRDPSHLIHNFPP